MNIEVIIPVVNSNMAKDLLGDLENNTLLPKRVIIIDNTTNEKPFRPFRYETEKFIVEYYYSTTRMVNESINLGISNLTSCDFVSILNDDIRVGNWFFQRVFETFKVNPKCGVACPATDLKWGSTLVKRRVRYINMITREGWALTFKKEVLDKIPPIPHLKFATFCGDDWFWYYTHKLGYTWVKDLGNTIHHFVGASVRKKGLRHNKRREKGRCKAEIKKNP